MYSINILIFAAMCINFVQCGIFSPCPVNDNKCFEASFNAALPTLLSEDKSLGITTSDPIFLDLIEGNLSIIKYKFFKTTTTGFSKCVARDVKINLDALTLHFELYCPGFDTSGRYEVSGRLIILPVEGEGDFDMKAGIYSINVDADLKKVEGDDGKTHLAIKNINLKNEAQSAIVFDFKNLFNGQKDLSDAVHKFANENWKEVADLVQDPVLYALLKKIVGNFNKYLKTVPLDEMFVQ